MTKLVQSILALSPRVRRSLIISMDIGMVLVSVPIALGLSLSNLSFDPLSWMRLSVWIGVGIFSHLLFRLGGLYGTVWRFASTPDFFNIIISSGILIVTLFAASQFARMFHPMSGLNQNAYHSIRFKANARNTRSSASSHRNESNWSCV